MNAPSMRGRPVPAAYRAAIDKACPTCGADPGEYCLVEDDRRGPRVRRVPCVRRCPPRPAPEPPRAHSSRSFSEPLHNPTDTEE